MRPGHVLLAVLAFPLANPAQAHPGGWGAEPWGREQRGSEGWGRDSAANRNTDGPAEGRVEVSRFVAEGDAVRVLGHGGVTVSGAPTGSGADSRELRTYEAAVIDHLAQLGYRTDAPAGDATQIAELHISHDVVVPQEQKRSPVSGEMAVGVSNRGSAYGLALNVDLTKPRSALIATRLEVRIRDKASGVALWQGRADVLTREGDEKWSDGVVAAKLATALFDGFPGKPGEDSAPR